MFWLARLMRLARPMPPTPTLAMFSVSLGGVNPRPRTCLGTMAHAAPPAATSVRNLRRDISFFLLIGIFSKDSLSRIGDGDVSPKGDHAEAGRDTLATAEAARIAETPRAAARTWKSPPTKVPMEERMPSRRPPARLRAKT